MGATLRAFRDRVELSADASSSLLFLDTNIVLAINAHDARGGGAVAPSTKVTGDAGVESPKRSRVAVDFLRRAKSTGVQLFTTPLVLEEVFHVYAMRGFKRRLDELKCTSPKELRRKHPSEFNAAVRAAVTGLSRAIKAIAAHGVGIKMYTGTNLEDAKSLGNRITGEFVELLGTTPELGGKDALHIVIARMLSCGMFASVDGDYRFVSDATVFCENPSSEVR